MGPMWLSILLTALSWVLQWLLRTDRLTASEQRKLNVAIWRARSLESRACELGCVYGGMPE